MDYERKYKEALERARDVYTYYCDDREQLRKIESIFPELKESEDERVRKWLIAQLEIKSGSNDINRENMILKAITWLEKQGEPKHSDKVEPKFHIGDWILYSGDHYEGVRHITKIDENGYYIERNGLPHGIIPFNHEICMRLWTIQDAKDGDVLYAKGSYFKEYIFMFSSFTEDNVISTHFGYDAFHKTFDTKLSRFGRKEDFISITPATKEQHDLLFQKMREAGYEWDAEKRELKKIEQSIEIPFGAKDSELQEASYYIPKGYHAEIDGDKVVIKKGEQNPIETRTIGYWNVQEMITPEESLGISSEEWNKIVDDSIYGEPRTAWSEEDEKNLQGIIDEIEANKNNAPDYDLATYDRFLDWLKSLKDRVQPKQEWSEEDEKRWQGCIKDYESYEKHTLLTAQYIENFNWLRSLRH